MEILKNEPYSNGPGGSGQYTHKLYHIAKHMPGIEYGSSYWSML